jgi:predicted transcriptional regulator
MNRTTAERVSAEREPTNQAPDTLPFIPKAGQAITSDQIRDMLGARRLRASFFGEGMLADPVWDILLDLLAAELEGARVSVTSACIASNVAHTTALRWIGTLTERQMAARTIDPTDRRRSYLTLTEKGRAALHGYFAATKRLNLPHC